MTTKIEIARRRAGERRRAIAQLRHGYYRSLNDPRNPYTFCPACRVRVGREVVAWATPSIITRTLTEALIDHLLDDCKGERS